MAIQAALYPAAIAATAAGTGLSMAGQAASRRAMQNTYKDTVAALREYDTEAQAAFAQNLAQNTRPEAEKSIQKGTGRRETAYKEQERNKFATYGATDQQSPTVVSRGANLQNERVAGAQARLGGYQDFGLDSFIKNYLARIELNKIAGLARERSGITPYLIQDAAHEGDSLAAGGRALSTLGTLAGLGAAFLPAKVATTAAAVGSGPQTIGANWAAQTPALNAAVPQMGSMGMWGGAVNSAMGTPAAQAASGALWRNPNWINFLKP